jgi:monofunctional biosynthetic peptidoglycan transglycosylase
VALIAFPVSARRLLRAGAGALLMAALVVGTRWWAGWPDPATLAEGVPERVATIEREREARAGSGVSWTWIPFHDISPHLMRAVLVAEDIDFFTHRGFAWSELRLAWREARAGRRPRGASTITQQVAKIVWLSPERTLTRKVREAVLARDLERRLTKRRILELYLNLVPFGPGTFGAEAAARRYFDKPALFLTESESAQLAAGLSRPSQWNPASTAPGYADRVALIQRRMTSAEFLWRHIADVWYRR